MNRFVSSTCLLLVVIGGVDCFAPCSANRRRCFAPAALRDDPERPRFGFRASLRKRMKNLKKTAAALSLSVLMWRGQVRTAAAETPAANIPVATTAVAEGGVGRQVPLAATVVVAVGGGTAVGRKIRASFEGREAEKDDEEDATVEGEDKPGKEDPAKDNAFGAGSFIVEGEANAKILSAKDDQDATITPQVATSGFVGNQEEDCSATKTSSPNAFVPVDDGELTPLQKLYPAFDPYENKPVPFEFVQSRRQPKSAQENAALKAKYDSIESLQERCFAILMDLGMLE